MLFEVRVHMIKGLMFCFILRISRLTVGDNDSQLRLAYRNQGDWLDIHRWGMCGDESMILLLQSNPGL